MSVHSKLEVHTMTTNCMITNCYQIQSSNSEGARNAYQRPWADLPLEILQLISTKLPLSEPISNFSCVCKRWRKSQAYPADSSPLLMTCKYRERGCCNFYSPTLNKLFVVPFPVDLSDPIFLSDPKFCYARDGWLLVSRGKHELFLVNPLSGISHNLPYLDDGIFFSGASFSAPPCFAVFCIKQYGPSTDVRVQFCREGGGGWSETAWFACDRPFTLSYSTPPVFHKGAFYCLGLDGTLGRFEMLEGGKAEWRILEKPSPPNIQVVSFEHRFLVESDERELFSVFLDQEEEVVGIFRLNEAEMEWEEISYLAENRALFVGQRDSSLSRVTSSMSNKIFLPRIFGEVESINARLEEFDGRAFFVPNERQTLDMTTVGNGVCYRNLKGDDYYKFYSSIRYFLSIWYQPSI